MRKCSANVTVISFEIELNILMNVLRLLNGYSIIVDWAVAPKIVIFIKSNIFFLNFSRTNHVFSSELQMIRAETKSTRDNWI